MSRKWSKRQSRSAGGVAVGIMNTTQALDMPETEGIEFSHPNEKSGETEVRLPQTELAEVVVKRMKVKVGLAD
jgi:hypothetical protein